MPDYHGHHYPTVCPYLYYEDGARALDFLTQVFGLTERMRSLQPDGSVGHAEVEIGDGVVMVGCPPDRDSVPEQARRSVGGVYVHVEDVDAHFARAKAAGARVQEDPTDMPYGVRSYGVLDSEGHQWWFSQPLQ